MYCVITFRFVLLVWLHDFSLSVFLHYRKNIFLNCPWNVRIYGGEKGVILECQEKYRKNKCMRSTKQKKEICADRGKKGTRKILNLIK